MALEKTDPNKDSVSVTVTRGGAAGEKAIICNGRMIYLSQPDGFLKKHEAELSSLSESGIFTIDGQDIYTEFTGRRKQMVVCGCGHVSIPIIKLAKTLGFYVVAVDDRSEFVQNAVAAGADRGIPEPFDKALSNIESDRFTYFVIVTRGHHWDELCLNTICRMPHAYIGAMGSRRRVDVVRQNLIKAGIDETTIRSIHSPIGLNIGAETPEEIAVSIMAEIIEIKNRNSDTVFPEDILSEIIGGNHTPSYEGRMILSTIIRRSGSAPRKAGTKMLCTADKRCINTIGGGLMESRVIEKSREMLKEDSPEPVILHLALNADIASSEGEVCGGELDVFLEEVL